MDLYLFPAPADNKGGYDIAVKDAYDKLLPKPEDVVVWACLKKPECAKDKDFVVYYKPFKSFHTIKKLCTGYLNNEFSVKDLSFLRGMEFEHIHCDDVVYYRAIRELYPNKQITVRFHNVFSRIYDRVQMLGLQIDLRFKGKMFLSRFLERKIMNDPLVYKLFLTEEDAKYYNLVTGNEDYKVWAMDVKRKQNDFGPINQLVWFGGIEGHKKSSVDWFLNEVWESVQKDLPELEFHMYGRYSENFDNKQKKVFGHGFYDGEGLPYLTTGLYVNPDVMGGGIKIKVSSYFNDGVRFISTPFGFEGYNKDWIDNRQCYVVPCQDWVKTLIEIIRNNK